MTTNVLIFPGKGGNPHMVGLFRAAHPELAILDVTTLDDAEAKIGDADIFLSWGLPRDIFKNAQRLKWVHSLGTGVNGLADAPSLGRNVILTATRGIHGAPMSEAAFMLMLTMARKFVHSVRLQDEQRWERFPPRLLQGKTIGIVGTGSIAQEFAPRCKAFGMRVIGFSRTERPITGFDEVRQRDELEQLAGALDFLVLMVPLDRETRGLIGEKILSAMKPSSFLINLARGAIIDDPALIAALNEGRIAGASLDTFVEEPLPKGHPFWTTPNTIVTCHIAGYSDEMETHVVSQFSNNLRHFMNGAADLMTHREIRS